MFTGIDLYSDTVTRPTQAMKQAMIEAPLGDSQKEEDPTTIHLEELMADRLGHTSAMFFPSATMANEVAIRLQCKPGEELIADEHCHLFFAEAGGPAVHASVMIKPLQTDQGIFTGEDVRRLYRWARGPHYPVTRMVSVENTTNIGGGIAWTLEQLNSVLTVSKELQLKTHLDGSRLYNASIQSKHSVKTLAENFDTVTICFSKGLGCPVGAILAFDKKHWSEVRMLKQLMGGAMRQSGMLAAACLYAVEHHVERLQEDHENAKLLANKLSDLHSAIRVEQHSNSTNMVYFTWHSERLSANQFVEACLKENLRFSRMAENRFRAVTHLDVSKKDIQNAVSIISKICKNA